MIIGFGGNLSGGKSIAGIRFCRDMHDRGKKIISNTYLNFDSDRVKVMYNSELADFIIANVENPDNLKKMFFNSVLFIDEIYNLLSARKSSSNLNEVMTNFIMMAGKLDCDVVYTYQLLESQADTRLREVTNMRLTCMRLAGEDFVYEDMKETREIHMYEPLINMPRKIFKTINGKKEIAKILILQFGELDLGLGNLKPVRDIFDPTPYFKMYDTREVTLLDRTKYQKTGSKAIGLR